MSSGLGAPAPYQTFANWVQKRRRQRRQMVVEEVLPDCENHGGLRWVEAVSGRQTASLASMAAKGHLRVQLPGGASLELSHRSQLMMAAELLRTLVNSGTL